MASRLAELPNWTLGWIGLKSSLVDQIPSSSTRLRASTSRALRARSVSTSVGFEGGWSVIESDGEGSWSSSSKTRKPVECFLATTVATRAMRST